MRGLVCLLLAPVLMAQTLDMEGLPIQMEWSDVNGDGSKDLVALMVLTRTEGAVETWFEEGKVRGLYEDQTFREKYLGTWLNQDGVLTPHHRMPLGQAPVLGFALEPGSPSLLILWTGEKLTRYQMTDQWTEKDSFEAPGLLAAEAPDLGNYQFWVPGDAETMWMVPDLDGIHTLYPDAPKRNRFLPYPTFSAVGVDTDQNGHQLSIGLPKLVSLDGPNQPELVFQGGDQIEGHGADGQIYLGHGKGTLVDLNGDGLADLFNAEIDDDIDGPRDLPKVTSQVTVHYATAPLKFNSEPDVDQALKGFILESMGDEMDLQMAKPFLDINGDGRPDLAGVAFKISMFQIAKAVATGRIKIKFIIHLSLQQADGRFKSLPGEPFELTWKINIRRLTVPSLAQVTADFNGDGWIDILMEKGSKLEITPIGPSGFSEAGKWRKKIPKPLRDPDQLFGQDLNGDGRAEFILMKLDANRTQLGVLEAKP